jgi:2-aminoethylphosphonate transport system permease protein
MLLWSRRGRAAILIGFAAVVLVVFVAPLATVLIAGLAGSWTAALPSDLGPAHFDDALSGENLASLSVSLQTAFISGALALVLGTWQRWPRVRLRGG